MKFEFILVKLSGFSVENKLLPISICFRRTVSIWKRLPINRIVSSIDVPDSRTQTYNSLVKIILRIIRVTRNSFSQITDPQNSFLILKIARTLIQNPGFDSCDTDSGINLRIIQ